MFIAHLPAGYLISSEINRRLFPLSGDRNLMLSGLIGSISPDFDLIYYYLIDNRQHDHHSYWSHYPVLWVSMLCLSVVLFYKSKGGRVAAIFMLFSVNGFFHMLLDSVCGDIMWFAPIDNQAFSLIRIFSLYQPWWLNFIFHWTFLIELFICCAFAFYYRKNRSI
jgi:hypothetical protein